MIFLAEAFTRPVADDDAREGRLRAELHVLHLEEHEAGARGVHRSSCSRGRRSTARTCSSTRPTSSTSTCRTGGPPAFEARLVLAATLSPSYGIYSGFESFESVPVAPGSEEYLDSEKYEVKQRTLDGPLLPLVQRLNEVRRAEPALQRFDNLRWLETESDHLVAYAKDDVICVVNVDPSAEQRGRLRRPGRARAAARRSTSSDLLHDDDVHVARRAATTSRSAPGRATSCKVVSGYDRARQLVRAEPAVVQDGGLLRDPHARVLRRQRRRLRRLPRARPRSSTTCSGSASTASGCCRASRARCATAATTSPTSIDIHPDYGTVDDFTLLRRPGAPARAARDRRPRHEPHLERPPVVPGEPHRSATGRTATGTCGATTTRAGARRASSSSTPSRRTGRGIPVRGQYYWHRFFSHQPDLNYDNPEVQEQMLNVLRFWLDLGLDGFRLDAVPYLYERDGTNGENLPETHAFLQARARRGRRALLGPRAARRGEPVAGRRRRSTSATATSARWRSTSRSCRACSWRCGARTRCR